MSPRAVFGDVDHGYLRVHDRFNKVIDGTCRQCLDCGRRIHTERIGETPSARTILSKCDDPEGVVATGTAEDRATGLS